MKPETLIALSLVAVCLAGLGALSLARTARGLVVGGVLILCAAVGGAIWLEEHQ